MTEDWTEDQRAGTLPTLRRSGETQCDQASSPGGDRRRETVTPARRERGSVASVAGPGPVTHIRRGQLSAFRETSWFSGKANGVIGIIRCILFDFVALCGYN